MENYKNVHVLDHPLIRHKLAIIRNKDTDTKQFRDVVKELATLMAYESFKDVPTQEITVETPLEIYVKLFRCLPHRPHTWIFPHLGDSLICIERSFGTLQTQHTPDCRRD